MAHCDCRWTCADKTVRSLKNTCHTWALLRWCFMKRRYIKCMYLLLVPVCYHTKFHHSRSNHYDVSRPTGTINFPAARRHRLLAGTVPNYTAWWQSHTWATHESPGVVIIDENYWNLINSLPRFLGQTIMMYVEGSRNNFVDAGPLRLMTTDKNAADTVRQSWCRQDVASARWSPDVIQTQQWQLLLHQSDTSTTTSEKALRETQTLRAGCSKAEPKKICPIADPLPGGRHSIHCRRLKIWVLVRWYLQFYSYDCSPYS